MSNRLPVILIYDVGKTNKKILLFDKDYHVVFEKSIQLPEIPDKDRFLCEDIRSLTAWIKNEFISILQDQRFSIKAINFSGYGASFVWLDHSLKLIDPLYNYLKPYPQLLLDSFYITYGGIENFSSVTASPALGSLNSGLQLYRIKKENPDLFQSIKYAIHLPQYLSYVLSGSIHSDITSTGCHTALWDFNKHTYHEWVYKERIDKILPPILPSDQIAGNYVDEAGNEIPIGIGLHDSSAALIPYQLCFEEAFILLSTGTWSISMNPFNQSILTSEELRQDCLCYFSYNGKQIKSSRLFAGHIHDEQLKDLINKFKVDTELYKNIDPEKNYSETSFEYAYIHMIKELVNKQVKSTDLIMNPDVKNIFIDGGFSKNQVFMYVLARAYSNKKVFAAEVAQASSLGSALVMHRFWNDKPIEADKLVKIQRMFLN
ncbi:MAG: FGGY-family carbohydrate kinase [Chitinophagaceae bacterium]